MTGANPWLRSPPRGNQISSAMFQPIANSDHTTPTQTRQPTRTTSVTQPVPIDTSPGARSSRQSNEINESSEQLDAANSEGHVEQGEGQTGLVPVAQKQVRKKTIGLGLERLVKRGNRMPIQVVEGQKRPDVPLQAGKLASETGVALRDQLPIFTSWKLYERDEGPAQVQKVLDKVATRLDVQVEHEGPSRAACTDIIKRGVKSEKNKANRGQVQLHQRTGSRSYIAHRYSLRPKYNNMELDPVEFFGECMNSPQNGRTQLADDIYSAARSTTAAVEARLQAQFQATLQAEREDAARKQEELQEQLRVQQASLEEHQSLLR
ncbi:unnamed protein product [Miscanthus lutarioriparius]|uniref:Uncharacterized protein n=1 Tax=Miscanthus lutarioriparius TaxID=422564 RepID=A0A811RJ56_9POAL|nr:unnamed protein product [Miscanthus lutarioriparius]